MKAYKFTAVGRYPFPTDMLRYDRASPCTPAAVSRMQEGVAGPDGYQAYRDRPLLRIELISYLHEPTVRRWNTFGWGIEDQEEIRV